ncbi:nitrate reductase molybdenum cofactor assembly chaperone [Streptomyces sp. NBC_01186]|uniref:nitrate reductase molybdenum cofactor assembly chaperone n=1 Tax=Streptomyces sp. NBC_01186 TaxID=2903765 RepID=UPI002E117BE6|nr:nitrate reductase molybdenum cofactor assembly chaperone [Streptomyces sp. NBC_01186]
MRHRSAVHQAASLLLRYPGPEWAGQLAEVTDATADLPGEEAALLRNFCARVATEPPLDFSARYITTFDRSRRRTLHLTYYTDGDTRRRGESLLRWRTLYLAHGWQPPDDELPDFLPLALEFAARCPRAGRTALQEHRAALELLRMALTEHRSPYADVLTAVCRTLPGASPADRAAALRLARGGPPTETVGLLPFLPRLPESAPPTAPPAERTPR